jgi:phosphate-selective porin OprO/OprP
LTRSQWAAAGAVLTAFGLLGLPPGPEARGQDGLPPLPPPPAALPPLDPAPPQEPEPGPDGDDAVDLKSLVKRLQKLEADNQALRKEVESTRALREQYQTLSEKYDELAKRVDRGAPEDGDEARTDDDSDNDDEGVDAGDDAATGPSPGGGGARGEDTRSGRKALRPRRINLGKAYYDFERDGFRFEDKDGEFLLRVRGLVQLDSRVYGQTGRGGTDVVNGFYLPRTRLYFDGHLTKPIEYQISLQRGYSSLDVLNAYLNFHYGDRFRFRVGRYKTPFSYEFYKINNWRLLVPERSLFSNNFGPNRQLGLMGWGELFDKRLEYAVGIFDGPRNSFQDFNNAKDVMAFLNFRPWQQTDGFLKNLNVGGSLDFGNQDNPLRPAVLRTSTNASTSDVLGSNIANQAAVPWLKFHNNVVERGDRGLWSVHLAYFYKGLTLMGSWDGGFNDYAVIGQRPVHLPVSGYYGQVGYIVTGEEISERSLIDPIRPFDLRRGKFGLGALEPYARYSELGLGQQVFTAGLADPNLWTNRARLVDLGVNWYLNKFVKIYVDWEHAMFGSPVYISPGPTLQKTSDLFWVRFQLFF